MRKKKKTNSGSRNGNPKGYREVRMDRGGFNRNYRNPMTGIFQYEYALYEAVANLFASVRCKSMCVDRLHLYFRELPHSPASDELSAEALATQNKLKQEDVIDEVDRLVARDVTGHITFPAMHICCAEVYVIGEKNGTHTFVFTDGIYGFSVHLDMRRKEHPKGIQVRDLTPVHLIEGGKDKENDTVQAARLSAA